MSRIIRFSISVILLVTLNVGCSSEKDAARQEIEALQVELDQKIGRFHNRVEEARDKKFSDGLDSLKQLRLQIDALQAMFQAKVDSVKTLFSDEKRETWRHQSEKSNALYDAACEHLQKAQAISQLKQKMIRLEIVTSDYKALAKKAAYTHFTANMLAFAAKHRELDSLNQDWAETFETIKTGLPKPLCTALQNKWHRVEGEQKRVQNRLYVNFARSVLYLIVKGDERAVNMLDWRNLVLDADQIGRVYSTIDCSTREKYTREVIQTTSGMFSYIFEASGNAVRNVRGWHLGGKAGGHAIVKARSESNEILTFTIRFSRGKLLLSSMTTG